MSAKTLFFASNSNSPTQMVVNKVLVSKDKLYEKSNTLTDRKCGDFS